MKQDKSFIGVNGAHKKILKKYITVDSTWKPQKHSWVGKNGYWILSHSDIPIDYTKDFSIRRLEGYTMEPENVNVMRGDNIKDYQYPSPRVGSYYELQKNLSDIFENFGNGTVVDATITTVSNQNSLLFNTTTGYFKPNSDWTGNGFFGNDGMSKDFVLGVHFYLNELPIVGELMPIFSTGGADAGYILGVNSNGEIEQQVWKSSIKEVNTSTNTFSLGWNSMVIQRINGVITLHTLNESTNISTNILGQPATDELFFGSSWKYLTVDTIDAGMSPAKSNQIYVFSNSNKTITLNTSAVDYQTARGSSVIQRNTGKWYFEFKVDAYGAVIWVGLGDANISNSTGGVGTQGWSWSSLSRKFNKQTGGGTLWAEGANNFGLNDVVGILYNSDTGICYAYKNGVNLGAINTVAINVPVEPLLCYDGSGAVMTTRFTQSEMQYKPVDAQVLPSVVSYSNKTNYSQPGSAIKNLYISPTPVDSINIQKLLSKQEPVVVFKNLDTLTETIIPTEWINTIKNDQVVYTLPTYFTPGSYENFIRFPTGEESNKFPVKVISTQKRVTDFLDDYSDNNTLRDNYYILNRQWGGANGGVVAENVFIRDGELILRGHGDLYTGDVQGVDRDGNPKFHTHADDPKLGQPWTNRVGACVVFKEKTGYGSYEVEAFIPNKLGVCYAMWTFFYNEIYPNDPRWGDFIADGLHQQGTQEDGYYVTRNHEIDIELPSHLDGGIYSQPSLSNMKCNTWRGELQNWDVPPTDPTYWEEYRDNLTPIGFNIADGNYHKLRYDWHNDRVEFYIDGVLKRINTNTAKGNTIPNIPGHFTFGLWFPSSPMITKPWLVRPERAWAGGVVDPIDGGMKADFDVVEMKVKKFTFTPFNEPGENVTGETYAFGGYRIKNDNNV